MYKIEQNDIEYADSWSRKLLTRWNIRPSDDNIQDGREAMVKAAHAFNPDKSNHKDIPEREKFWNLARYSIKNGLLLAVFGQNAAGIRHHACIFRSNEKPVSIENFTDFDSTLAHDANTIDRVVDKDRICKAFNTMQPAVAKSIVDDAFLGIAVGETSKKLGYSYRSLATMLGDWRKGAAGVTLNTEERQKAHWCDGIRCDLEYLINISPHELRDIIWGIKQKDKAVRLAARQAKKREFSKKYYWKNRENILAEKRELEYKYAKKYYKKNRETILKKMAEYHLENKARINERKRKYRFENKARINERKRIRYAENKTKIRDN